VGQIDLTRSLNFSHQVHRRLALGFGKGSDVLPAPAADAARGQVLATKWCANCHLLDAVIGSDSVPSLQAIAAGPRGLPAPLRVFLTQPHAPMPPLQLSNQEIEDLIVFIQSLNPGGG
jgi:cytochrome c